MMSYKILLLVGLFGLILLACETPDSSKAPMDQPPTEQPTNKPQLYSGEFVYGADAASFKDCQTGKQYPVTGKEAYLQLEKAYLQSEHDAFQPEWVQVEGHLAEHPDNSGAKSLHLVVDKFIGLEENRVCE